MDDPGGGLEQLRDELVEISLRHRRSLDTVVDNASFGDELFGFIVQQVVELRLKAVLAHHGTEPPRTHDIGALADLLEAAGLDVPAGAQEASDLTKYAVAYRYTIANEHPPDRHKLVSLADGLIEWSSSVIGRAT